MKKLILFTCLAALLGCKPSVEVQLTNKTDMERKAEMVEVAIDRHQAGFAEDATLVVRNDKGKEIPSQTTYDGLLIFQADIAPNSSVKYTVSPGKPRNYTVYVCGKQYPGRLDDLAWENDLIAFRIYGPALQATGERSFGNDVWVKKNTDLPVVEERYAKDLDPETRARIQALRQTDPDAAKILSDSTVYHVDHGNGMDVFKVGPTLGAGGTALLNSKGEIVYPYCYKTYKILDNGPLRFTAELTYNPTVIDGRETTEHRIISIDKGSFVNRTTVWYDGFDAPYNVLSGIVIHQTAIAPVVSDEGHFVCVLDPCDHEGVGEIYVSMIFPDGWQKTGEVMFSATEAETAHATGHVAVYNSIAPDSRLTYYWGAQWNRGTVSPVPSFSHAAKAVYEKSYLLANPIEVEIEKK